MKNIWIDGYEANVPQRLGSSQVAFELLKNIEELDNENNYTILLPNEPFQDLPKPRKNWQYKILKPAKLWTRLIIPAYYYLTKEKPDIILSPTHYIPAFIKAKRITTIFDLSFLRFPEMFQKQDLFKLTKWTQYSAKNSEAIITISDSSKNDIKEFYKIPDKKITVAYPGYNENLFKPINDKDKIQNILDKYKITGNYIIYIGTIQPRKNLLRLIQAFRNVILSDRMGDRLQKVSSGEFLTRGSEVEGSVLNTNSLKLVIAGKIKGKGKQGWMNEEILEEPKKLKIEEKIIFTDFVPTEELPYLISGSRAFVLPSLWEGFGIPVVEAMACGVPVITSCVSSLPEVTGDAGLLVDPKSTTQLEQAIRLLTTDQKLHAKLSKKALEQAKKFSWQQMAEKVIKVLESA